MHGRGGHKGDHHDDHHHHDHGRHGHGHGHHEHPRDERGPDGSNGLQLELGKMAGADAMGLAVEVAREILREAIRARLRERLGARIEAVGRVAADALADDVEASLDIEARVTAHTEKRRDLADRLGAALRSSPTG